MSRNPPVQTVQSSMPLLQLKSPCTWQGNLEKYSSARRWCLQCMRPSESSQRPGMTLECWCTPLSTTSSTACPMGTLASSAPWMCQSTSPGWQAPPCTAWTETARTAKYRQEAAWTSCKVPLLSLCWLWQQSVEILHKAKSKPPGYCLLTSTECFQPVCKCTFLAHSCMCNRELLNRSR